MFERFAVVTNSPQISVAWNITVGGSMSEAAALLHVSFHLDFD